MSYFLNSTADYHINDLNSLGWELTVCNALYPATSPCRKVLQSNISFGASLYHFLDQLIDLKNIGNVLEVGGGTGNLMHDFLSLNPGFQATMIDISPHLLARQKELLRNFTVNFRQQDILNISAEVFSPFDLIIMNENLGDLPVLVSCSQDKEISTEESVYLARKLYFTEKYGLSLTSGENVNIGAMEVVEKLCIAGIKYIYLSEHSCEAVVPDQLKRYIILESPGTPEKISLKGHNEYTIKFSCLQRIAETFNYKVIRGPFADILKINFNDRLRTALQLSVPYSDEQEILQHFAYDLYKYEYLVLIKGGK